MHKQASTIRALGLVSIILGLATGCKGPPGALMGVDASGIDASADGSVDAGPIRRLTTRRFFGTMPVENGVVDPTFSTIDHSSWSPYSYSTGMNAFATPMHLPTPTGLPALRLIRSGSQASLTGLVRSAGEAVEISLWCGRPASSDPTSPRLSLIGLYPAGQGAADFEADPETPEVTLGEIVWTRYLAELAAGPIGWATLRIIHQAETPLYLNAPALLSLGPSAGKAAKAGGMARRPASVRPLTAEEREEWAHYFGRFKDRFGRDAP
ncbi:MAG: hypothetical protein RBU30_11100 [Polyangia bacterium]|jgi:hypothetical protein|nr:hypothetical protein [Polyangia bacterium]